MLKLSNLLITGGCIICLCLFYTGCSLKYDEFVRAEDKNPEFIFSNTKLIRYEDGLKTAELTAEAIEQYRGSDATYAKNIKFKTFDKNNKSDTEGSCGFLYANSDTKIYQLYDNIRLFSATQKANFFADMLKWNAATEQLTGGRTDTVKIEKDGTVIYGSGFSASGISGEFVFTGSVSGDIETKENNSDETED